MASAHTAQPRGRASSTSQIRPRPTLNDLAIRVGTVNGSGSQSANLVLLRALHGMGIPCSGKNVFPSNIEGLPTWFHIRASAKGYVGHRLDPPILVCMNEQTAADDVRQLRAGARLHLPRRLQGTDLAGRPRRRPVLRRPVPEAGRGGLSARPQGQGLPRQAPQGRQHGLRRRRRPRLRDRDGGGRGAIRREFPGRKAKAAEINIRAARGRLRLGRGAPARPTCPTASSGSTRPPDQILIEGNKAAALGRLFGGASVLTWYPITPSSSLAEYAEDFLKKHRVGPDGKRTFAVVQAEDELAAVGMAIGAGWAGARAITATSRPGHLADDRVRRPGLLRRDPGRHHRRPAHGARAPACPPAPARATSSSSTCWATATAATSS